ncbi:MAG: hypothetical protein JO352_00665 [Chloroflexi bacterium]|nr:hypothetical protein [Chloroflexota bacterium]MBV9598488.1 hypothetical protein [Chloroflexota bacterium]
MPPSDEPQDADRLREFRIQLEQLHELVRHTHWSPTGAERSLIVDLVESLSALLGDEEDASRAIRP